MAPHNFYGINRDFIYHGLHRLICGFNTSGCTWAQVYDPNLTRATTLNVHLVGGPWRCWALHIVGAGDRKSESTSIPLVQIQTTAKRHRFNNCTNPHIVWFGAQTERFPPPICHVAIKSVSRRYCSGLSFLFTLSTGSFTSQPFEPKESFNSPLLPRLDHSPLNWTLTPISLPKFHALYALLFKTNGSKSFHVGPAIGGRKGCFCDRLWLRSLHRYSIIGLQVRALLFEIDWPRPSPNSRPSLAWWNHRAGRVVIDQVR